MYPFFETIRYYNGILENLNFHQQRVDQTLANFKSPVSFNLSSIKYTAPEAIDQVYKCRISYNLQAGYTLEFEPYQIKLIQSILVSSTQGNTYAFKFSNRAWIKKILAQSSADEILMTDNDLIKDTSYANVAFFNGEQWHTPKYPLLNGTKRSMLITQGLIIEKKISINDLKKYSTLKLINAMMTWEESPTIDISILQLPTK